MGADVKNGALDRLDLGVTMRSARSAPAACGDQADYEDCVSTTVNLPRAQRLLLVASAEYTTSGDTTGECLMEVDDNGTYGPRDFGEIVPAAGGATPASPANVTMNDVTGIFPAGSHRVDLSCRSSGGALYVLEPELSVAAIGDG